MFIKNGDAAPINIIKTNEIDDTAAKEALKRLKDDLSDSKQTQTHSNPKGNDVS